MTEDQVVQAQMERMRRAQAEAEADAERAKASSQGGQSPVQSGASGFNQFFDPSVFAGGLGGGNAAGGMTMGTGSGTTLAGSSGGGLGLSSSAGGLGLNGSSFASGIGSSVGGGAASGGGAAGAASSTGLGGSMAAAGPWAALAAAIMVNEKSAKDGGYRREGADYYKDLATGRVMYQDVDQRWAPKLFGEKDKTGLGGDMRAAAALGSLQPKKALDHIKNDSSLGKLLKKIF